MKHKYEVVPAELYHVNELAENLRQADKDEVWAAGHMTPKQAILFSLAASRDAQVGLVDGRVVCMFGVGTATVLSHTGVPWLLATDELEQHKKAFLKRTRKAVERMRESHSVLRNYVDARNTAAVRWLKWIGFNIHPPEKYGMDGLPFHPFEMRA